MNLSDLLTRTEMASLERNRMLEELAEQIRSDRGWPSSWKAAPTRQWNLNFCRESTLLSANMGI